MEIRIQIRLSLVHLGFALLWFSVGVEETLHDFIQFEDLIYACFGFVFSAFNCWIRIRLEGVYRHDHVTAETTATSS